MGETRRGIAVLLTGGDAEIAGALAAGMLAGRAGKAGEATPSHEGERRGDGAGALMLPEPPVDPAVAAAEAAADAWLARQRLKRVVKNPRTDADYEHLITEAAGRYGRKRTGPVARRLWELMGLLVIVAEAFTRWEEAEWRGEARRHAG